MIHYLLCQQRVILITFLSVRCYKNLGVNNCRGWGSYSSDSTDVVRTFEIKSGMEIHIHMLPFCVWILLGAPSSVIAALPAKPEFGLRPLNAKLRSNNPSAERQELLWLRARLPAFTSQLHRQLAVGPWACCLSQFPHL